jgi:transposase
VLRARIRSCRFAHRVSALGFFELEVVVRFIGVDVHRDFCEVAVVEDGGLRFAGQVASTPSALKAFACSLEADDVVALEATANALAIARIIEPRVERVVLADPKSVKRITGLRAKTDKIDAALLARLLAAGFLAEVWTPDEPTRVRRRLISRRMHLVRQRVREKKQVHAVLQRQLKLRPPMTDVFGVKGGIYLSQVEARQGRSMAGTGGDRIGSVGRGRPGRGLTIRLR